MDTVNALVEAFIAALNDQDADALGKLFIEDADFVNVLGMRMTGRSGIVEGHDWAFRGPLAGRAVRLGEVRERSVTDDVAVLLVQTIRHRKPGAPEAGLPDGSTVIQFVLRRDESGWVAVGAMNVNEARPAA